MNETGIAVVPIVAAHGEESPNTPNKKSDAKPTAAQEGRQAEQNARTTSWPQRETRLVVDEATGIVQAKIYDARTKRLLVQIPEDQWLRVSASVRQFIARSGFARTV